MALKPYAELRKFDVHPFCEKRKAKSERGESVELEYLNWAKCTDLLHENGAEVVYYEPVRTETGSPLWETKTAFTDKNGRVNRCYEVRVKIIIDELEFEFAYPVINGPYVVYDDGLNQRAVHTAQARAFVKGTAIRTGLGFDLWVKGDDSHEYATEDDLYTHNALRIKERLERILTAKLDGGMSMKDIHAALGVNEKTFNTLMEYPSKIHNFEAALKKA